MLGNYKKLTKNDIDFPKSCLFFIEKINEYVIKNPSMYADDFSLETSEYPYCSDVFELVTKTFRRKGYFLNSPTFKITMKDGKKIYNYNFSILNEGLLDLPF